MDEHTGERPLFGLRCIFGYKYRRYRTDVQSRVEYIGEKLGYRLD